MQQKIITLQMVMPYPVGLTASVTPSGVGTWIDATLFKQIWPCCPDPGDTRFSGNGEKVEFILNNGTNTFLQNGDIAGGGADDIRCSFSFSPFNG